MKTLCVIALALGGAVLGHADFSYTQTQKMTGGMMAGMAARNGPQSTKVSLKGQKMKMDNANFSVLIDFDAQTVTTVNIPQKTYTVRNFSDMQPPAGDLNATAQVKETGQTKTVNGYNARELVMTMEMQMPQVGKAQMDMTMWISADVPGVQELRDFYAKNADKFPWTALGGGSNPGMASAMAEVQKKMATLNGAPVQQIIRVKVPGAMAGLGGGRGAAPAGPSPAQMSQMQAGMEKARKQLEALAAGGGPAAAIAKQQLERMGPAPGAEAAPTGGAGDALIEMTIDSSDFSGGSIPDAVFQIPAGYTKN